MHFPCQFSRKEYWAYPPGSPRTQAESENKSVFRKTVSVFHEGLSVFLEDS